MLVLTRKQNESIAAGSDIRITVQRITGGQVPIGIEAPDHVPILREELQAKPAPTKNSETGS